MTETSTLPLRNPRSGQIEGELAVTPAAEVAAAAAALRAAQPQWERQGIERRCERLAALAEALAARRDAMIEMLLADTGRWHESVIEVDGTLAAIRRWAAQAPACLAEPAPRQDAIPFIQAQQTWVPYPVVGVISPWNFPLMLTLIDAVPALAAGCTVLAKPSEVTSRFVPLLREALAAAGLGEVFALVTGAGDTGQAVIEACDHVCFTGSVATGRKVAEACARRFIPASLELGGKDPALVLSDADVAQAARALAWGSFVNGGQSCMSIERVYVEAPVAEAFIAALVKEAAALDLAWPDPKQGRIGPIIAASQVELVRRQLAEALAGGARALTGGELVEHGGTWCPPTVLVGVDDDMAVMREESFATVLPVKVVADENEAVACANASEFGLSAAVFSGDPERAQRVARQLHAGAVSINDASLTAMVQTAEKQSFGHSGMGGSRMGSSSIRRFVRARALLVNTGVASPWWFPAAE
ncbi:aldehyde dehydrogenase family protein [Stenotrophomonas sp. MYb238]|uniref:aldehyde dehydrogenase family protein n=1 Tax=Stenotrophomonas sp. MYb238 TaxID=2040281 RepID=UPI0012916253|nr:aldehyde dehydrogenase family protein [Stenotrophomonas sp. MYb238]MQP76616.1 aldehyde dehydrogenase family protein [Stenotrophomonas sp. MYb238]